MTAQPLVFAGVVVDGSGGAIPGATVVLIAGGQEQTTITDASGRFTFDHSPSGTTTITVTVDRFAPVTLDVNGTRTDLRIELQPAPFSET